MLPYSHPAPGERQIEIRQIFYSEETRLQLDPGFIPLDNCGERPDWREYWPIRKFLLGHALDENTLYGFFSPKFRSKTTLDSAAVFKFLRGAKPDADVIAFSPFFDQAAVFINVFEQAGGCHPGIRPVCDNAMALVMPGVDLPTLLMDSRRTIFCNYFVATPKFWRHWLEKCEMLFSIAESGAGPLAGQLNATVKHGDSAVPSKTFVIERMVSLLLAAEPHWSVDYYDPLGLPWSNSNVTAYVGEVCVLDALKSTAMSTGSAAYLQVFHLFRNNLLEQTNTAQRTAGGG